MNIGLYGGSFNPVHNAHLDIIKDILSKKLVDQVWILPCKNHAFDKELAPIDNRLEMLELALSDLKSDSHLPVRVDLTELEMSGKSYTSDTVKLLREKYSSEKYRFSFICGADVLPTFDKWHDVEYIKKTLPIILVKRPGYIINSTIRENLLLDAIIENDSNISSSIIRERIALNKSLADLVPQKVEEYINIHKLYSNMVRYTNPASTVDLIVPTQKGIVFIKRKHPPFKGKWAFPGGYLNTDKETLEEAGVRELFEETHLVAKPEDLVLMGAYSEPKRDPRGHVIAHAYIVTKFSGTLKADDDAAEIAVFKIKPEDLAFDHSRVYDDYIKKYGV
jgi:nicotinate (nicotinamide) nucleotide adenylyltransferase